MFSTASEPAMSKPVPQRRARPHEDYQRDFAQRAYEMTQAGMTDVELAREFNVNLRTIYRWRQADPAFDEACRIGKGLADERVVAALQRQAVGYDYDEEQAIKLKDGPDRETVEVVTVTKHQPANQAAAIFWLKNRQRELWSDRVESDVTLKVEAPTDVTQLALALLATLQQGVAAAEAQQKVIEHEAGTDEDD